MLQMHSPDSLTSCITVATSTEDDHKTDVPVVILESRMQQQHQHQHHSPPQHHHTDAMMITSPPPIMSTHAMPPTQVMVHCRMCMWFICFLLYILLLLFHIM